MTWPFPGSVTIVDPGAGEFRWVDAARLEAVRLESECLMRKCEQARARSRATRDQIRRSRSRRDKLRAGCIPVVEQAKGIVMAQQGCRPEEAFDLLRRASLRANVRVYVLAAQIVDYLASSENGNNVTPISLGAIRCLR